LVAILHSTGQNLSNTFVLAANDLEAE